MAAPGARSRRPLADRRIGASSGPAPHAVAAVLGLGVVALVVLLMLWTVDHTSYDVWGAVVIGPILLAVTVPLARRTAATEEDPRLARLIMLALVLKLLAAVVRYLVAFEVYDGSADAKTYISEGARYAEQIRQGDIDYVGTSGGSDGTHFIRQLTGWIFALTGPTAVGGFLVYSWLGFLGLYGFFRAFRVAVPHGDHRRYAMLVFFLPSLLYWPSSIGKEAWMLLTLGLSAYAVARIMVHRFSGYLLLVPGLLGAAAVRPHMAALLAAGLPLSYLLRRSARPSVFSLLAKGVGALVILAALTFAVGAAEERFGVEGQGLTGAEEVIDRTSEQTSQGGSEFEAERPDSIADVPLAAFTVLFRPLPHEAHNLQALLTSFEGVLLLALFGFSWRRLRGLPRECWRTPYVMFCSTYSLLFMLTFSSFGNFGILVRQRAQLFPLALVVLALPAVHDARRRRAEAAAEPWAAEESASASPRP